MEDPKVYVWGLRLDSGRLISCLSLGLNFPIHTGRIFCSSSDVMYPLRSKLCGMLREHRRKRQGSDGSFPRLGAEGHPLPLSQPYFCAPQRSKGWWRWCPCWAEPAAFLSSSLSPWEQGCLLSELIPHIRMRAGGAAMRELSTCQAPPRALPRPCVSCSPGPRRGLAVEKPTPLGSSYCQAELFP